jgi:hypothetical protein
MQYAILIYLDPAEAPAPDTPEGAAEHAAWMDYTQALAEAGVLRGGEALHPTTTATTVRVREGETLSTDGPFAETKEILAGFYLIDVPDLDAAMAWAARIPSAGYGSVELRPTVVFERV